MEGPKYEDPEEFNRYLLKETDFVNDALSHIEGLDSVDWTVYDVAAAIKSLEEDDLKVLEEAAGDGVPIEELEIGCCIHGDDLDGLENQGFIRRTEGKLLNLELKALSRFYLDYTDSLEYEKAG